MPLELLSILDFLIRAILPGAATFRKRFSVPIERYHDAARLSQLRGLVKPFILRRLKTDPGVAADLPEKLEMREYSPLTTEQAELYETVVNRMLAEVEAAEGMQRRGLVLSTLIKLKQICNHPSQYLKDHSADSGEPPLIHRSGKVVRLVELLEQAIDAGDQSLIFTQFRQMGGLLASMLRHRLDREVLFFHGGTPQGARVQMVDRFQREGNAAPILIVSLKAGGVGLNLTAATHVFPFDRWWNPAVENQATDRAHRIGQYRTVQVHKFVVRGTLEERIDEMIEQKTELAENIIGSGEAWLTELSTDQLRDMLTLRRDAVGDEDE
jgi:SNF2 family DNA or RNA helicase